MKDIYPGERSGAPISFTPFGDYMFFQVTQRLGQASSMRIGC